MGKVSVFFIKVRVLFWPEISAIGVFLYFDNERMRPSKYQSPPPPESVQTSTESIYIPRGVQLSHCRTSLRQGLRNMRQVKGTV